MRQYLSVLFSGIAVFGLGVVVTIIYYQARGENLSSVSSTTFHNADAQSLKAKSFPEKAVKPQKAIIAGQVNQYEVAPVDPIIDTEQDRLRAELLKSRNQPLEIGEFIDAAVPYQLVSDSDITTETDNVDDKQPIKP